MPRQPYPNGDEIMAQGGAGTPPAAAAQEQGPQGEQDQAKAQNPVVDALSTMAAYVSSLQAQGGNNASEIANLFAKLLQAIQGSAQKAAGGEQPAAPEAATAPAPAMPNATPVGGGPGMGRMAMRPAGAVPVMS